MSDPALTTLAAARRIVVKVGSALLVGPDGADARWLAGFAADVARLRARGQQVLVVSSAPWRWAGGGLAWAAAR